MSFGFEPPPSVISFAAIDDDSLDTWTARLPADLTKANQVLAKQRADLEVARQALLSASSRLRSFVGSCPDAFTFLQTGHTGEDSFWSEPSFDRMDASDDHGPLASLRTGDDSLWPEPALDLTDAVDDDVPLASPGTDEHSLWPETPVDRKDAINDDVHFASFGLARLRWGRHELDRLMQNTLKWLFRGVWVETYLGGTLLARTQVWQNSEWSTSFRSAAPEEMALHRDVLSLALDSLWHSVDLMFTVVNGAIALSPLMPTPGMNVLLLPAVQRFVEQVIAESLEPGSF
jgi:hypothetical protein